MIKQISNSTFQIAERLSKLEHDIFETSWDKETINKKINLGEFVYWVFEVDKNFIGYSAIHLTGNEIHLLGIGVSINYRKLEIGKELLTEVLRYFNESIYTKILLEVRESNTSAIKLYESMGFVRYGIRRNYYKNEDGLLYFLEKINV